MKSAVAASVMVALLLPPSARAGDDKNLLRNGDFEAGGESSINGWMTIVPPNSANPAPKFLVDTDDPHGGARAGSIVVDHEGGCTSFTQVVMPGKETKFVHLEGFARIDHPNTKGSASLVIWFAVPGAPDDGEETRSRFLVHETAWTLLSIDAPVPKGTTVITVRCGVLGPCSASFDDLRLTLSDEAMVAGKLAVAQGDYTAKTTGGGEKAWISISIPFPFGGQTPLAIRATSEPAGRVVGLAIDRERDNRPLKVLLAPQKANETVSIRVETLALLRDRPLSDGKGIFLAPKAKIPKEVLSHLLAAPGIDVDAAEVKKVAAGLPKGDLGELMAGLKEFLRDHLKGEGGASQGAVECLRNGKAVCTGYANTAASLLIASKVPTRILACTQLGGRLQEHYIVEAWTPDLGWSRMESAMARFPWKDSENLVLRIIYPDAERSNGDVPLYKRGAHNVECEFKMGSDDCWQGSELLRTCALDPETLATLESAARGAFEELVKTPARGASVLLIPDAVAAQLGDKAAVVATAAGKWLRREE